jgi:hypothetical protein
MITDRQAELIHAELDGELTGEDRAELARLLLANPEARALRDQLGRLFGALESLPSAAPPPDLAPAVLRSIGATRSKRASIATVQSWWGTGGLRYAAVFVGGLIVSAALLRLDSPATTGPDLSLLVGTIGGHDQASREAQLDQATLDLPEAEGTMSTYQVGSQLVLELDLRAHRPVEIVAVHSDQSVTFSFGTPPGTPERVLWLPKGTADVGQAVGISVVVDGEVRHQTALGAARVQPSE